MRTQFRLLLLPLLFGLSGCGTFIANRMAQAPNTYPAWFAPRARVLLGFDAKFLTNFPARFVEVGPPAARLCYRVVDPADFHLTVCSTNWLERGHRQFDFSFLADVPGRTNEWTARPRGTVFLLHGYGLAQFSMAPWAIRLAEEGWRCVLVDLRGHGKSTGKRIFFGLREADDLSQLLDILARGHEAAPPISAVGESYGAALALRWKASDPRVGRVVAIAPYASLSNAVLNICEDYAGWFPQSLLRAGLKKLPSVLHVRPDELDTATILSRKRFSALFIAGAGDKIAPSAEVQKLAVLSPRSELIVVPEATHEALTYFFDDLSAPVLEALDEKNRAARSSGTGE